MNDLDGYNFKKKARYRQLCEKEPTIPIFSKDWWLDSICGNFHWDVALVEENGDVIASLPYYYAYRGCKKEITMPMYTQVMGPWLKYPDSKYNYKKLSFEKKMMTALIDQLPEFSVFVQNFHYNITNWLPFCWKGFMQSTRYTYIIEDISDHERVFKNFTSKAREKIRKAQKIVSVHTSEDIELFF